MAFKFSSTNDVIKVVSRKDTALPADLLDEEFEQYQRTLDESYLRLTEEPTRFVLKKSLPFEAQQNITNQQIGISKETGKAEMRFGFMLEEVRCALTDIENPASLPEADRLIFRRDTHDRFAAKEIIAILNSEGIVSELYAAMKAGAKQSVPEKK
jgi:hypothetical protein